MDRKKVLIDTSLLIDHLRKEKKDKSELFSLVQNYECTISAITHFEFAVGTTTKNREFVNKLLS